MGGAFILGGVARFNASASETTGALEWWRSVGVKVLRDDGMRKEDDIGSCRFAAEERPREARMRREVAMVIID